IWTDRSLHKEFDDALLLACEAKGLTPRVVQETSTSAHILSLVAVGMGIGLLPATLRWRNQYGVKLISVSDLKLQFQMDVAWRRDDDSTVLKRFIEVVLSQAD